MADQFVRPGSQPLQDPAQALHASFRFARRYLENRVVRRRMPCSEGAAHRRHARRQRQSLEPERPQHFAHAKTGKPDRFHVKTRGELCAHTRRSRNHVHVLVASQKGKAASNLAAAFELSRPLESQLLPSKAGKENTLEEFREAVEHSVWSNQAGYEI